MPSENRNRSDLPDILTAAPSGSGTPLPYSLIDTPLGTMLAIFGKNGLCALEFAGQKWLDRELNAVQQAYGGSGFVQSESRYSGLLRQELADYFAGRLKTFSVPLEMIGTAFQQQAWQALLAIPYGETRSYKQQAELIGKPSAVRAVAAANSQNKISILVPCHRVIGSNGKLTGYAGGVERKQFLLSVEQQQFEPDLFEQ